MPKYRTFTPEFKAQIVLEVISGARTVADVCRQHCIKDSLFYRWKAQFVAAAPTIFGADAQAAAAQPRVAELERLVGRLTLELEVAKKASSLSLLSCIQ